MSAFELPANSFPEGEAFEINPDLFVLFVVMPVALEGGEAQ